MGDEGGAQANIGIVNEYVFMALSDYEEGNPGAFSESDDEVVQETAYMFQPTGFAQYYPGNAEQIEEIRKNVGQWMPDKKLPEKSKNCNHSWKENCVTCFNTCHYCGIITSERSRLHCPGCEVTACALCSLHYLKIQVKVAKPESPESTSKSFKVDEKTSEGPLLQIIKDKDEEIKSLIKEQAKQEFMIQQKEENHKTQLAAAIKKTEEVRARGLEWQAFGEKLKDENKELKKKEVDLLEAEEKMRSLNEKFQVLDAQNDQLYDKTKVYEMQIKEVKEKQIEDKALINKLRKQNQDHLKEIAELEKKWQEQANLVKRNEQEMIRRIQEKEMTIKRLKDEIREFKKNEESVPLTDIQKEVAGVVIEMEVAKNSGASQEPTKIKKIVNQLYNVTVDFDIPECRIFKTKAIIDIGASSCYLNKTIVPEEALELVNRSIIINGLNSQQEARHKVRQGYFSIEGNKFRMPLIYVLDMTINDGIQMLIGVNFLRSMQGGIRIEGDEITIYKKVTKFKTSSHIEVSQVAIEELGMDEIEYQMLAVHETIYKAISPSFVNKFNPILDRLKKQGFIGEDPLKHWKKNGELCKLDIINPDVTIEDKPLKDVTPAMEAAFIKHIKALLQIGVIRESKSRHRTRAMFVNSGTTVDLVTGKEIKGKERLVFNYVSLNDNTYKDQYSLPGINTIVQKVKNSKILSKFDLKSGFHQVAMAEESIPWTAFITPNGFYEWLVMPFGLKNAPAIFQRKMNKCFAGTEDFIAVYIDDILVFSKDEEHHAKHLTKMLMICEDNGLILSPSKMKIAVSKIDFLGVVIGEGSIQLQPHIIKKIVDFDEESLKTKKGLRSFLGILNYA